MANLRNQSGTAPLFSHLMHSSSFRQTSLLQFADSIGSFSSDNLTMPEKKGCRTIVRQNAQAHWLSLRSLHS
jgi:hypothetical protein